MLKSEIIVRKWADNVDWFCRLQLKIKLLLTTDKNIIIDVINNYKQSHQYYKNKVIPNGLH